MVSYGALNFKNIDVYGDVTDEIEMGSTHAYRLDATDSFFNELDSVQIELASFFGDADLQVIFNGKTYSSQSQLTFD